MRKNIYINDKDFKLIQKASKLESRSLSNFFVVSAKQRADKIINIENLARGAGDESTNSS